jgi:hypothetical protein
MRKHCKRRIRTAKSPKLACYPWKVEAVFYPLDRIMHRLESEGTVEVAQGRAVFREEMRGGWYDMAAAMEGIIEFHTLAEERHGLAVDLDGLIKLRAKLQYASPLFDSDLAKARASIEACKRQALQLTLDEAQDLLTTVQISSELDKIKPTAPANLKGTRQTAGNSDAVGNQLEAA